MQMRLACEPVVPKRQGVGGRGPVGKRAPGPPAGARVVPKRRELRVLEPVVTRAPEPRAGVRRMKEYHPPVAGRGGLRLDFNENTLACSPRVIEALKTITAA